MTALWYSARTLIPENRQKATPARNLVGVMIVKLDRSCRIVSLYEKSDCAFDLVGTEASCTDVNMAGGTVNDCFHALDVGLPSSVGTSVGVRDLNAERNALAAEIALCQIAAPPIVMKIIKNPVPQDTAMYNIRIPREKQEKFYKKIYFFQNSPERLQIRIESYIMQSMVSSGGYSICR